MADQLPRVFISSAHADIEFAHRLRDDLEARGFSTWIATNINANQGGILSGEVIEHEINASDVLVVILSPDAFESAQVREEYRYGLAERKMVIPILYRTVEVVPFEFVSYPLIDFREDQDRDGGYEAGLDALASVIRPARSVEEDILEDIQQSRSSVEYFDQLANWLRSESVRLDQDLHWEREEALPRRRRRNRRTIGTASPVATPVESRRPHFSAFHPNTLPVQEWHTLLMYTHSAEATSAIQEDAVTFTELGSAPVMKYGQSAQKIPLGTELTVEPHVNGVTFSPERERFIWDGTWHRSLFKCKGEAKLAGTTAQGWVDVYAGRISPIATLDLSLAFHTGIPKASLTTPRGMAVTTNTFDTVFISYSHRDVEAFRQARQLYERLGVTIYIDDLLEAGDNYDKRLKAMVEAANVFHLLWSHRSAKSDYVRKEWTWALESGKGERFIRPWYWTRRLTPPPHELKQQIISFRYEHLQRQVLRPSTWL